MSDLYKSLDAARERRNRHQTSAPADTLRQSGDEMLREAQQDSLAHSVPDSTVIAIDSTLILNEVKDLPATRDTTYMSERELRKAMRIAKRDARWAELDQRDADKAAAKQARKDARKARREAREAARLAKQAKTDAAKLQKYIERYEKKKARHESRKQKSVPAGKRSPGAETGGELPAPAESEREAL